MTPRRTKPLAGLALAASLLVLLTPSHANAEAPPVTITGQVANPASYTPTQLAAASQVSVTGFGVGDGTATTYSGPSVASLVTGTNPRYDPAWKNPQLRVALTVRGTTGERTLALGELDANYGGRTAILALKRDGVDLSAPELILGNDQRSDRSVAAVTSIEVAVASSPAIAPATTGGIAVVGPRSTTQLGQAALASLRQLDWKVTYNEGSTTRNRTEVGPTLADVLRAAGAAPDAVASVAAVGNDGYSAVTTPDEAVFGDRATTTGARALGVSLVEDGIPLAQPRTLVVGDLRGGRYVSGLYDLVITCKPGLACDAPPAATPPVVTPVPAPPCTAQRRHKVTCRVALRVPRRAEASARLKRGHHVVARSVKVGRGGKVILRGTKRVPAGDYVLVVRFERRGHLARTRIPVVVG